MQKKLEPPFPNIVKIVATFPAGSEGTVSICRARRGGVTDPALTAVMTVYPSNQHRYYDNNHVAASP